MAKVIRVLLVCDQTDCQTFSEILLSRGCIVAGSSDCEQAIELATFGKYDAVVIDTTMPDASGQKNPSAGIAFMHQLKEAGIKAGIVLLTDRTFLPLLRKAQELGHSGILSKDRCLGVMDLRLGADVLYRTVAEAAKTNVPTEEVERILAKYPFAVTWDEHEKLNSRAIDALQRKAHQLNDQWADKERQRLGADWVLLCGDGEFSGCIQELPSIEWLEALGYHNNRIPFLFIHPPDFVETVNLPSPTSRVYTVPA